jgi:hypothetical protein
LTIVNGNITASGRSYSSGIGSGHGDGGTLKVVNLTILNGNMTASSKYGSGIGSGYGSDQGNSAVENLTILNGNITASSSSGGAGIRSGGQDGGKSTVEALSIQGGRITSKGVGSGIGSGGGEVTLLRFFGSATLRCDASAGQFAVDASPIVLADASMIFQIAGNRWFGRSPSRVGRLNLTILYGKAMFESGDGELVLGLNAAFLGIGNVTLPIGSAWAFRVSGERSEAWVVSDSLELKGLLTSVPAQGLYSVFAEHPSGVSGHLLPSDEDTGFLQIFLRLFGS